MERKKEIEPEGFEGDNYSELVVSENLSISFFVMNKPVEDDDNHKYL
jgi:hypothetical protein